MHDCVWICTVLTYAYNILLSVRGCGQELTKGMKESTVGFFPVLSFPSPALFVEIILTIKARAWT